MFIRITSNRSKMKSKIEIEKGELTYKIKCQQN